MVSLARAMLEEGTSTEEVPLEDWSVSKAMGNFPY